MDKETKQSLEEQTLDADDHLSRPESLRVLALEVPLFRMQADRFASRGFPCLCAR